MRGNLLISTSICEHVGILLFRIVFMFFSHSSSTIFPLLCLCLAVFPRLSSSLRSEHLQKGFFKSVENDLSLRRPNRGITPSLC